jgi:hypothetical protein
MAKIFTCDKCSSVHKERARKINGPQKENPTHGVVYSNVSACPSCGGIEYTITYTSDDKRSLNGIIM